MSSTVIAALNFLFPVILLVGLLEAFPSLRGLPINAITRRGRRPLRPGTPVDCLHCCQGAATAPAATPHSVVA